MTVPVDAKATLANAKPRTPVGVVRPPTQTGGGGFGATPPDHRTTALQSAVAVMRGNKPIPETSDVLNMAEAFYQFLKQK